MTDEGDYLRLTEETIYDWWRRLSMTDGGNKNVDILFIIYI
jgi:hypothetical protein